ncbi:MAG: diaminopimelate dehydrogenase [Oscillospiraceae bacterium]|jgi:diaminopimelate dehydrogenase|nr:diaminopimelate dehydrogenase [Oscillospiraceae bacterium]
MSIRVGIAGYGNIGRAVETVIRQNPDMTLTAVLTRREPQTIQTQTPGLPVYPLDEAESLTGRIDVMILCGGSAKDLPEQGPRLAALFNTVDSFDTHAVVTEYFGRMNAAAARTAAVIAAGWDPGLFSAIRLISEAFLPEGVSQTFWGRGVSQGHSDALRRVAGVRDAVQYTVPKQTAVDAARNGTASLTTREKHLRECFVVAEAGADRSRIEQEIKTMPHYFDGYDTVVHFVESVNRTDMPHAGLALRSGTSGNHKHLMEMSLSMESNPEFSAGILLAYARAAVRLSAEGSFGAKTVFDIPLAYLSPKDGDSLRRELI